MNRNMMRILLALAMTLALALPATGLAMGNSDRIVEPLNADLLETVTINATGVDIVLRATDRDPYAELDAVVVGVDSADVGYDLKISEQDGGTVIDATHTGRDYGINYVVVTVYVPQSVIRNLVVGLSDSDLTLEGVDAHIITGTMTNAELEGKRSVTMGLNLTATDSDIEYKGQVGGIDITATRGEIDIETSILPAGMTIVGDRTEIDLKLPETAEGFTLAYDVKGGRFETDFIRDYHRETGSLVHGSGAVSFSIASPGGKVEVERY